MAESLINSMLVDPDYKKQCVGFLVSVFSWVFDVELTDLCGIDKFVLNRRVALTDLCLIDGFLGLKRSGPCMELTC